MRLSGAIRWAALSSSISRVNFSTARCLRRRGLDPRRLSQGLPMGVGHLPVRPELLAGRAVVAPLADVLRLLTLRDLLPSCSGTLIPSSAQVRPPPAKCARS